MRRSEDKTGIYQDILDYISGKGGTAIVPGDYYNEIYSKVGGLMGLLQKRLEAGESQQINPEFYINKIKRDMPEDPEFADYQIDKMNLKNLPPLEYINSIKNDKSKINLKLNPQSSSSRYANYEPYSIEFGTQGNTAWGQGLPEKRQVIGHELLHRVQQIASDKTWGDRDKTYNGMYFVQPQEIEGALSGVIHKYMAEGNKPIINQSDVNNLLDYINNNKSTYFDSGEQKAIPVRRYLDRFKLSEEDVRYLAPKLVTNKQEEKRSYV